jgi:hypothetical protein
VVPKRRRQLDKGGGERLRIEPDTQLYFEEPDGPTVARWVGALREMGVPVVADVVPVHCA